MKKLLILGAAIFALLATACTTSEQSTFTIYGEAKDGNVIEFIVTSSVPEATYVCGLLTQEIVDVIGGEAGLTSFVNTQLANTSSIELHTGPYTFSFEAEPLAYYYYYVAQVDKDKLVGTPVLSEGVRIELPYKRIIPQLPMVASSISDNGTWVVGNQANISFVYNRVTDVLTEIPGVTLYDISDNGVAVGMIDESYIPVTYEDGEIITVTLAEGATQGSIHSITPDGGKMFGYMFLEPTADNPLANVPIVIENGVVSYLSLDAYIFDESKACGGSTVLGSCGSNGAVSGYIVDQKHMWECGAVWKADGELVIIGAEHCNYVPEIMFYDFMYGDMFTRISPNGRWVAGVATKFEGGDGYTPMEYLPFLYDVETGELFKGDEDDFNIIMKVTGVSNDGLVFISDAVTGVSESETMVWTAGGVLENLQYLLEDKYGVTVEQPMIGDVISTTADGRTFVISGYTEEGGGVYTDIYSF